MHHIGRFLLVRTVSLTFAFRVRHNFPPLFLLFLSIFCYFSRVLCTKIFISFCYGECTWYIFQDGSQLSVSFSLSFISFIGYIVAFSAEYHAPLIAVSSSCCGEYIQWACAVKTVVSEARVGLSPKSLLYTDDRMRWPEGNTPKSAGKLGYIREILRSWLVITFV